MRADAVGAAKQKAGLVLVDDHPIVREGLARVIEQTDDLAVLGEADNIASALEVIEKARPDLVVVDISLGRQSGLELIKDIQARHPTLPVLVHSMHDESMYAERCLRAGATGYVMKQEPPQRLLAAARAVLRGEIVLSEAMTAQLLHRLSHAKTAPATSPIDQLTDREFEVFELIGRGYPTRDVARQLHLSPKTVQTYREHIKEKLNLSDGSDLVRYAVQWAERQR